MRAPANTNPRFKKPWYVVLNLNTRREEIELISLERDFDQASLLRKLGGNSKIFLCSPHLENMITDWLDKHLGQRAGNRNVAEDIVEECLEDIEKSRKKGKQ